MKWEDICSRCGLCCHEKIIDGNYLIITDETCEFYNRETQLCTVYEDRFKKCPRCLKITPFKACFASYLPSTCSYVAWAKSHHIRLIKAKEMIVESEIN